MIGIEKHSILALVALSITLLLSGCGGSGDDDGESGSGSGPSSADAKELFAETCGSCHALADAKTSGTVGPALDDRGYDTETVSRQIEFGGGAMPPALLAGKERDAVAKYVADASS